MCQTLLSIDSTCMASNTACACLRHLHACGTCMLAALALVQHVHDGGISMCLVAAYALALVLQMHMCGKCMCAALCAFCKTCMAMASCSMCTDLPPGRGSFASLAASPCALQDLHGYGQLQHVHCFATRARQLRFARSLALCIANLAWLWPTAACALICHQGEAASLRSRPRLVHRKTCMGMANCSMFTDLPPGRGSFASLAASPCAPRSCSHGKHGLKPMPAPADVGCQGSQHRFKVFFFPFFKTPFGTL